MIVTISVTAEDIASGDPGEACYCPIALAALRVMSFLPNLAVRTATLMPSGLTGPLPDMEIPLPQSARDFIGRFDNALPVEPFSFELDIPGELMAEVAR